MAENQSTEGQKMLVKILRYSVPIAVFAAVVGGILDSLLDGVEGRSIFTAPFAAIFFASAIVAALTFIAYLVSLVLSKN